MDGQILKAPFIEGFTQIGKAKMSEVHLAGVNHLCLTLKGRVSNFNDEFYCPDCKGDVKLVSTGVLHTPPLFFLPSGGYIVRVVAAYRRLYCPCCGTNRYQIVKFRKCVGSNMTLPLENFIIDLMAAGASLLALCRLTGKFVGQMQDYKAWKAAAEKLHEEIYRRDEAYRSTLDPQKARFEGLVVHDPGESAYLKADEFNFQGKERAFVVTCARTGHIIWLDTHKRPENSVKNMLERMDLSKVKSIACSQNQEARRAFRKNCPHLQLVRDFYRAF